MDTGRKYTASVIDDEELMCLDVTTPVSSGPLDNIPSQLLLNPASENELILISPPELASMEFSVVFKEVIYCLNKSLSVQGSLPQSRPELDVGDILSR